ncbi:MAG: DNA-directed RNA polymerase subunit omega [Acidobacteria bacterium]|nr:DNA-directed RNA polymerase subunit omega [Acidobacteriota bacterium]MCA1609062.1 DNA-directed RNA polymerase subunit omega [Acidobacteriota bacterium]
MAQPTSDNVDEMEESTDELYDTPELDSKYRLILLAAQRSKQLQRGALSRTEIDTRKHKSTRVAMKEIENKKIRYRLTDADGKPLASPAKK